MCPKNIKMDAGVAVEEEEEETGGDGLGPLAKTSEPRKKDPLLIVGESILLSTNPTAAIKELLVSSDVVALRRATMGCSRYYRQQQQQEQEQQGDISDNKQQQQQLCKLLIMLWNRVETLLQQQASGNDDEEEEIVATLQEISALWMDLGDTTRAIGQLKKAVGLLVSPAAAAAGSAGAISTQHRQHQRTRAALHQRIGAIQCQTAHQYDDAVTSYEEAIRVLEVALLDVGRCSDSRSSAAADSKPKKKREKEERRLVEQYATTYCEYVGVYEAKADFAQALLVSRQAVAQLEQRIVSDNSSNEVQKQQQQGLHARSLCLVCEQLGKLLEMLEQYDEAIQVLDKALAFSVTTRGVDHPKTSEIDYLIEVSKQLSVT